MRDPAARKVVTADRLAAAGLFGIFLVLFWALPSQDYVAVDGAVRSAQVFWQPRVELHGNNHLLYPVWVSLWAQLNDALGRRATDAIQFIRLTASMNALLAASIVAMLYLIARRFSDGQSAVLSVLILACSTTFMLHATNAAEPLAGLFLNAFGMVLLLGGLDHCNRTLMSAAGAVFVLAMASYQGMACIAGVVVLTCALSVTQGRRSNTPIRSVVSALAWTGGGVIFGLFTIYGLAYSYQAIPFADMASAFWALGGSPAVYGGVTASKIVNIPLGLIQNLYDGLPPNYTGIRAVLRNVERTVWLPAIASGIVLTGTIAVFAAKALGRLILRTRQRGLLAPLAIAGGALLVLPLAYWEPIYDKLWLLPLATLACVLAACLRPDALPPAQRTLLGALTIVVLAVEIVTNVPNLVMRHRTPSPHLRDAESLGHITRAGDWVVIGFDDVSILWAANRGHDPRVILLPASSPQQAADWLQAAHEHSARGDGRILFVGVLDQNRHTWDLFLGNRVGIRYEVFDEYRARSAVLQSYSVDHATITVREYNSGERGLLVNRPHATHQ